MAGQTNYLRNKLIDLIHRAIAWTPPTTHYIALVTTTPTAAAAGTEVTGTGYARQAIALSATTMAATNADASTTSPSSGTTGKTSNNAIVNFGTAGAAWGTVTYYEIWDASTAGNRLFFGPLVDSGGAPTSRSISSGDPVSFPISAMTAFWT